MEEIINERATKHFKHLNIVAAPLWLVWILFDYWYADDNFIPFLVTRIFGALFSMSMLLLIRSFAINIFYLHILFFAYYNAIFSYYISAVSPPNLQAYFNGYILLVAIMFFVLILRSREILIFSFLVLLAMPFIIIFGDNSYDVFFASGGFAMITVLVIMNTFGLLRFKGVLRDISLAADVEKAKTALIMNEYLEKSNREKEVLLQEVHHRVKNNLQIISSILNLQRNMVTKDNIDSFTTDFKNRIKSISNIHENLYKSKSLDQINISKYLKELMEELVDSYQENPQDIQMHFDIKNVELSVDQAIPCGLIVNELVTNSIKHAFRNMDKKTLHLTVDLIDADVFIKVCDNGIRLPENFNIDEKNSLGMSLIKTLCEQLNTDISFTNDNGVVAEFKFQRQIGE